MKVTLTINGKTADLNEDGLILLTYQNADAENPAAVKNSYSQNITLPSTPANDAIFSHILRSDFKTGGGFNPLARTPFEIRSEAQEVLVSGYLKLNSGEVGKGYDISLFGGLGGFFYSLMYREDGTKRTLADLSWVIGDELEASSDISINVSASAFASRYNGSFDANKPYAFAPFNEGIPQDFDADKAYYKVNGNAEQYEEIRTLVSDGEKSYSPKNQGGGVLLSFSNKHDAWELQEFRNTLQRPMWSIRAFLLAICQQENNGGYDVAIDQTFLTCGFVQDGYVTLKNDWGGRVANNTVTFADLLTDTQSPAEYLLSLAKICGLMFVFDEKARLVQIFTRDTYYGRNENRRLSLQRLVAEDKGKVITPLMMSDKWQVLSAETYGGRAADYAERKGRQYGSLWLNTNYEFGGNEKEIFADSVFKGAADTLASNINYRALPVGITWITTPYWLKFSLTDTIKYNLYTTPDISGSQESKTFEPFYYALGGPVVGDVIGYNENEEEYSNITELTELCDADGKAESGDNVIVFYSGNANIPAGVGFYATDTPAEMLELNGDKPCWNLYHTDALRITQFPIFRRQSENGWSALFARPGEFFTPNPAYYNAIPANKYLGQRTWSKWLAERCGVDVRRMKCWVNLHSATLPKVGADLLSHFWFFENAWWVLDKINSHSLTTPDLTECEFVKVVDIDAYTQGQDFGTEDIFYLRVSPSAATLLAAAGSTATVSVESNTSWSISGLPSWLSASRTSGSGNATIVFTAQENPSTQRQVTIRVASATRSATVVLTQNESTEERYELTNVRLVYSSGSQITAKGDNYARILSDVKHYRGSTLIETLTNQALTPVKMSGDDAFYVDSSTHIKAENRTIYAGPARSASYIGTYEGYSTSALTVTQGLNRIEESTDWEYHYYLSCSDMSEVSRLGETRGIYCESNRERENTYTSEDHDTTYQQYSVTPTTNLATGLPSSVQGYQYFNARFPSNSGAARSIWIKVGDKTLTWTQAAGLSAEVNVYAGTLNSDTATQKGIYMWYEGDGYTGSVILRDVVVRLDKKFISSGLTTHTDYQVGSITLMNGQTIDTGKILPELTEGYEYTLYVQSATLVSTGVNVSYPTFLVPFSPFPKPTITEITDADSIMRANYSITPDPTTEQYTVRLYVQIYRNGVWQTDGYGRAQWGKHIEGEGSSFIKPFADIYGILEDAGKEPFTATTYKVTVIVQSGTGGFSTPFTVKKNSAPQDYTMTVAP